MLPSLHDHEIYAYTALTEQRRLLLHIRSPEEPRAYQDLVFSGAVAHELRCVLDVNIILDVEEGEAAEVVEARRDLFADDRPYGWPTDYTDEADLVRRLNEAGITAFWIVPSYGLSGWVLAQRAEVVPRPRAHSLE